MNELATATTSYEIMEDDIAMAAMLLSEGIKRINDSTPNREVINRQQETALELEHGVNGLSIVIKQKFFNSPMTYAIFGLIDKTNRYLQEQGQTYKITSNGFGPEIKGFIRCQLKIVPCTK